MPRFPSARGLTLALCTALVAGILAPSSLPAQVVRGTVVEGGTGKPVGIAFVILLDEAGERRAAVLANESGGFVLRAPGPGRYRLRAEHIGLESTESAFFRLGAGATHRVTLEMATDAILLEQLVVEGERRCDVQPEAGRALGRIWEETRKALSVAEWTEQARLLRYEFDVFRRSLDARTRRPLEERRWQQTGFGAPPFAAASAEDLLEKGFVQDVGRDEQTYYGPGLDLLLSDAFLALHCFGVRDSDEDPRLIGLTFEPADARDVPDIEGVFWLDSETAELRSLDFRYTGLHLPSSGRAGGRIEFERLPAGHWMIRSWRISGPVLRETLVTRGGQTRAVASVARIVEEGGDVIRVSAPGAAADIPAAPASLAGTVYDRGRAAPLAGARVVMPGSGLTAVTDSAGHFRIEGAPAGVHVVSVLPAVADPTAGALASRRIALAAGETACVHLAVGTAAEAAAARERTPVPAAQAELEAALALLGRSADATDTAATLGFAVRDAYMATVAEGEARDRLRRALEADPALGRAARLLAALALELRDGGSLEEAARALRASIAAGGTEAASWLMLADVEIALGWNAAAAGAARAALDAGADSSSALHALARGELLDPGQEECGAGHYLQGIAALSADGFSRYLRDVLPLLRAADLAVLDTARLVTKVAWLERFWEVRAAAAGRPPPELLASYQQRLALAHRSYRRMGGAQRAPGALIFEPDARLQGPFDERGLVLLRYGEPETVVRTPGEHLHPNETWAYSRRDGRLLFHFVKLPGASDFRLVDDIMLALRKQVPDPERNLVLYMLTREAATPLYQLLEDRIALEPRYAFLRNRLEAVQRRVTEAYSNGVPEARLLATAPAWFQDAAEVEMRLRGEHGNAVVAALETEDHAPRFARDLPFRFELLAFRGGEGRTELTAAIAIPADLLAPRIAGISAVYRPRVSLIVFDSAAGSVFRLDTTLVLRSARRLGPDELINTHVKLELPPMLGASYRIAVRGAGSEPAGGVYGGTRHVLDYSGPLLGVSDIVVARADSGGSWTRGRIAAAPVPWVRSGDAFVVFYEVYGLPAGAAYRTELSLEPLDGRGLLRRLRDALLGGRSSVRLRFTGEAPPGPRGVVQEWRRVNADLPPGRYRLTARLTDLRTGGSATATRELEVLEPAPR